MAEWRVYSGIDGECFGSVGTSDWTEEEALEYAQELFGENVYVEEVNYF